MRFLSQSCAAARAEYGSLFPDGPEKQLIVISDDGQVWRDERAWLVCLWALRDYRRLSHRLASPLLRPLTSRSYKWVARHRQSLSRWWSKR